ncbi:MAG: sulfotransferase [Thermodesulfobacteriota bacterium]
MSETSIAFLLSAPYSGATLLSMLANRHPAVSCDGETFPYERGARILCSCGRFQDECDYFRTAAANMLTKDGSRFDPDLFAYVPRYSRNRLLSRALEGFWLSGLGYRTSSFLRSLPAAGKAEDRFVAEHMAFIEKSLALKKAGVYLDGTKSMHRAELFAERGLTTKAVYLLRDPRGFCNSYRKNKRQLSPSGLALAAGEWKVHFRKVKAFSRRFDQVSILTLRYDELCHDPAAVLGKACEFLSVPFSGQMLKFSPEGMHVTGNRMRHSFSGEIREDVSWKKELSAEEIRFITSLLAPEISEAGFPLE